ncbi:RHS repeat-associated core domain-containing protein [Cytophagaceae bacterium ABcell3]|nr:RHS repeat-associated core domain-containing protein [Cytophagaceae bacterium ABcell3]
MKRIIRYLIDALYRLLSATGRETATTATEPWDDTYRSHDPTLTRGYTQHYSYDKMGNIQGLQHIATGGNFTRSFQYSPEKNILEDITIGQTAYGFIHDVNGNIIREGESRHFAWDYADRLKSFRIQAGEGEPSLNAFYLYDSGGNRIKKLVQKQDGSYKSTTYIDGIFEHTRESISAAAYAIPNLEIGQWTIGVYDQGTAIPDLEIGQWIIGQYGGSTTEQNTLHIMDDQSRIATIRLGDAMGDITPAIKYNLEDHLGSSCIQVDSNGTLVSREEYTPFGETSFGSYGKKRYRFCGKEKDEESGLYYYGMRYYNAWTCRFVSVDPLAPKYAHLSPFAYADNKPINHTDIDGAETGSTEPSPQSGDGGDSTQTTDAGAKEPKIHTVVAGDTLSEIAQKYGVSTEELRNANNLDPKNDKKLQIGTKLKLPEARGIISSDALNEDNIKTAGPNEMAQGRAAHRALSEHIEKREDSRFWRPNKAVNAPDDRSRPDIVYEKGAVAGVWELKPGMGPSAVLAAKEAKDYVTALNEAYGTDKYKTGQKGGAPAPLPNGIILTDPKTKQSFMFMIPDANNGAILWYAKDGNKDPQTQPVVAPETERKHTPQLVPENRYWADPDIDKKMILVSLAAIAIVAYYVVRSRIIPVPIP